MTLHEQQALLVEQHRPLAVREVLGTLDEQERIRLDAVRAELDIVEQALYPDASLLDLTL